MQKMNRITDLRKSLKLSQADLARYVGCTQTTISKYELEQIKIPPDVLAKLCQAFDCSADYLLGLSDIKKPPIAYSDERPSATVKLDGSGAEASELFKRIQQANSLFLRLDDTGKAQAIAYLQFLAAQQSSDSEPQE